MEKKYTSLAENEAIYQEHTVTNAPLQQTVVIYHQPQSSAGRGRDPGETRHECQILAASADRMYALSICWCVVCCLCGSPLTLACFIPAIVLSVKVNEFAALGEAPSARKALFVARILTTFGIAVGVSILAIVILWRASTSSSNQVQEQEN